LEIFAPALPCVAPAQTQLHVSTGFVDARQRAEQTRFRGFPVPPAGRFGTEAPGVRGFADGARHGSGVGPAGGIRVSRCATIAVADADNPTASPANKFCAINSVTIETSVPTPSSAVPTPGCFRFRRRFAAVPFCHGSGLRFPDAHT
jgi:hypothetical protein